MSLNKVILIGNLGQDPELRHTTTGMAVCNFSVATHRKTKDASGDEVKETEWHRIVVWREQAGLCDKYLRKGRQVYIEGTLRTEQWQDKEGNERSTLKVHASKVVFLDRPEKTEGEGTPAPQAPNRAKEEFTEEDIPF